MPRLRLLIVSKYTIVRSALRHLLASATDIEVVSEVENLQRAEQAVHKMHPDVVLLETADPSTPTIPELTERIRRAAKVPVVILSTDESTRYVRAMLRAGVTGYVLKQSSDSELLVALRSAAAGRKFLDSNLIDAIALEGVTHTKKAGGKHHLSRREVQVIERLVRGYTSPQIAQELHVSTKTVETYRSRIYEKLELHSRTDLMHYAITIGLISVHDGLADRL